MLASDPAYGDGRYADAAAVAPTLKRIRLPALRDALGMGDRDGRQGTVLGPINPGQPRPTPLVGDDHQVGRIRRRPAFGLPEPPRGVAAIA